MSLVLVAASSQYARRAAFTAPAGYTVAMGCQFKATAAATQGIIQIGQSGGNNRFVGRNNLGGGVNITEASNAGANVADAASSNGHTLNSWNWVNLVYTGLAARKVLLNGTTTSNATNVAIFPAGLDEFILGAIDVAGIANFFGGKIANAWVANSWSDTWDVLLRAGSDPRNFMGASLLNFWPLSSDYSDVVGGATLTGTNSPTFDAADQPALTLGGDWTSPMRTLDRTADSTAHDRLRILRNTRRL
jgi:hypothetical protein